MPYENLYQSMFLFAISVAIVAAGAIWRRRYAPGGTALFWMTLAIVEWNFSGLMQVSVTDMQDMILWSKAGYLGGMGGQLSFFIFVLEYTHHQKWLTRRNLTLLFIMPVLTILLAVTNEYHSLIWSGFSASPDGVNLIYHHGAWFWVTVAYINSILFIGSAFLFQFILRSRELYRLQNIGLVIATLFPWAGFILYASGANPFPGLDIVAISFAFTGAILVFIISRYSFLDVIPIARESLVDDMPDGLLVFDKYNRIVDINPAALQVFRIDPAFKWIGTRAESLFKDSPELLQQLDSPNKIQIEWDQVSPYPRSFDVQTFPLYNRAGRLTGRSIVLRDITHLRKIEKALLNANHRLEDKLVQIEKLKNDLHDQSIHDALTGLFNRRYIEEAFAREVALAEYGNYPLSLIIIDIDHFKEFNDTCGHDYGDKLLQALGATFRTHFRIGDIACRYGGDEFLLLMPQTSAENAFQRMEAFREACKTIPMEKQEGTPPVTISAGIASHPTHATSTEELFRVADQALYQAKAMGRNRICIPSLIKSTDHQPE